MFVIGSPKKDRKQSIKNNRSLCFHFDFFLDVGLWGCGFVRIFGCSLISHELLDKTYIFIIYAHHQNELNEEIKMVSLFVLSTYISRVINEDIRKMAKTKI